VDESAERSVRSPTAFDPRIVAEALHDDAVADIAALLDELQHVLTVIRAEPDRVARLSSDQPSITTS
jgi:hypothetical protein